MRALAARAVTMTLLLLVAGAEILPCPCHEMTRGTAGGHCGRAESGLQASSESCACACMRASDAPAAVPRAEPAFAPTTSLVAATRVDLPGPRFSPRRVPPQPLGDSPPPSRPRVLRI